MDSPKLFSRYPQRVFNDKNLTDLNVRFSYVRENLLQNALFYEYTIKDEERPDHVSYRAYDTTKYDWVILLTNDIYDVYTQWPKTNVEIESYLIDEYGSLQTAFSTIHHYEDGDGDIIDLNTYNQIAGEKKIITVYEHELKLNDAKRDIKIVERSYINQIELELRNLIAEIDGTN